MKVFCAGAVKAALGDFAQAFERDRAVKLELTFGTVGALRAKAAGPDNPDVLILTEAALEELASADRVLRDTIVVLGQVGVGIAVRKDAASPDVSTPQALRETLLVARSLTYGDPAKGDSSGIHFAHVLERLGIAEAVRAKTVLAPVGLAVAELVAGGDVEIGATQASVIAPCEAIKLAGLLPDVLQHTTTYAAAVAKNGASAEAGRLFVASLATAPARARFARAGLQQPS